MTTVEFLSDLRRLDIKVWAENGQLRCSAPKGALTPTLRTELADRKAEILTFLQAAKVATHTAAPAIPRVPRHDALPLSFAQQRLWFLDQLESGGTAYNISAALSLVGALDTTVLERSLNQVIRRHETLRTTFALDHGRPVQRIMPTLTLVMPIIDLQAAVAADPAERDAEIKRWADEEAQQPFDLAAGPLLRATLLRLAPDEHVLLLTLHHIISDGWSSSVLVQELSAHYTALLADPSHESGAALPELSVQYADYAVWQREQIQGDALAKQLAYWKQQLRPEGTRPLPVLQLPSDQSAAHSTAGASHQLDLSPELTSALKSFSQREGSTLFMTLLAAFTLLLARHSEQDDIILGSPIANRTQGQTEGLIGLFLNTLALRVNLSGDPSFRDLLKRTREVVLDAYAHQDVPFEKLVEELQPERALNRHPIFDVLINLNNTPDLALQLPGLDLKLLDLAEPESKFTMTLYAQERGAALSLKLVYQRDRFSHARMVALLNQLHAVLEQAVAAPDQPIQSYSLVTPDAQRLLPDPHESLPMPPQEPITSRISALAQHAPAHPAIAQDGQTWSYEELVQASQTLARVLLATGQHRGDRVAITGARSFGLIASIIGVLTSGGVIVTLAQDLPASRQRVMIEQAGATRVLYVGPARSEDDWLRELDGVTVIDVGAQDGRVIEVDATIGERATGLPQIEPDDAAYVFFTSGTTGVPKGVLGRHCGLAHFLRWQRETFEVQPGDRSAQLTGLSFDVVLRDIFLPLTSGATLVLPGKDDTLGPTRLMPWLERERISLLHTVPSLARSWLGNIPDGITLQHLRCVFFAGEPLTDTLIARWRETFPEAGRIVNLYGPTETTLAKCYFPVPDEPTAGVQPVGWPLPQTQALVLRTDGQLCGIGEPGEIVIRTPFRSLGYINVPEESKQRFRPNPFAQDQADEHDLLYFTGDRGRYRADGALEIIGRIDHQVKIRGARVELGEIEAALSQHPAVRANVVVVREDERGENFLVGYAVPGQETTGALRAELRSFLETRLPGYMVPSIFMLIPALPLSSNGKINRGALPEPERYNAELAVAYLAPRSPLEQTIAAVWQEVLHLDKVGMHDNFFELGGHSLLLLEVQVKLQDALGRDISVIEIFQHPTISALAEWIEQAQGEKPSLKQSYDRAEKRKSLQRQKPQTKLKR